MPVSVGEIELPHTVTHGALFTDKASVSIDGAWRFTTYVPFTVRESYAVHVPTLPYRAAASGTTIALGTTHV